jgi:predicted NBD/HSP70 family sugar kinase
MTYLLFDVGGTTTRVAVSIDGTTLSSTKSFKTPLNFADGIEKITIAAKSLLPSQPVRVAGGVRGLLTEDKSGIENDAVLHKWAGKSIVAALTDSLGVPVRIENDTALAGLGEAVFGAGAGLEIIAYHSVSTGVGGVKIERGRIDAASMGFEPGHQILDIDRTILGDDIVPTLENLVSGTAVGERYGMPAYEIPQSDVVWDELAEYLAQGLRNTILYWSPDAIVLGGAMIVGDPRISIDAIRKYTVAALDSFVPVPLITAAKLGDESGLFGALALASGKHA